MKGWKAMLNSSRHRRASQYPSRLLACSFLIGALLSAGAPANAEQENFKGTPQSNGVFPQDATATFPLVFCWYRGEVLFYIQIDTSDKAVAQQMGLNYVPQLGNVLTSSPKAYDDTYTFTNFRQFNVVPSAPDPVGPKSADPDYQPLWQVSKVAWNSGSKPRTLKSEEEILAAAKGGEVTITQTNVIINCPIVFRPGAGKLPNVKIEFGGHDKDRDRNRGWDRDHGWDR